MNGFLWFLVCWFSLNMLAVVWYVDRPRPPITSGQAMFTVALNGALIWWTLQQAT